MTELPKGLSVIAENCTILGFTHEVINLTKFSVISSQESRSLSGTFSLKISRCPYNAFDIVRTYGSSNVFFEVFDVQDLNTQTTIVNVTTKTPRKGNEVVSYRFCSPITDLRISLRSTVYDSWYQGSKLEVFGFVPDSRIRELLFSGRMDTLAGLNQIHYVRVAYEIQTQAKWYYHFDDFPSGWISQLPKANWVYSSSFPSSTNQIQLYKAVFDLPIIPEDSSFILSLHYQEGILIYLNGKEIYRSHLSSGPLTPSSLAISKYNETVYHTILISQHYIEKEYTRSYFRDKENILTVAVIHTSTQGFQALFDCSLRFTGYSTQYRSYSMTAKIEGFSGYPESIIDINHESWIDLIVPSYPDASIILEFPWNHKEVISKVVLVNYFHDLIKGPTGFDVYAKEEYDSAYTFLIHIDSISWKKVAQNVVFWINSGIPYNALKFTHFISNEIPADSWRLSEILLFTENLGRLIPSLKYQDIQQYQDVPISKQFPPTSDYFDFHITPSLPAGITLDSMDGEISGVSSEVVIPAAQYTLSATRFDSRPVSCRFTISIPYCSYDHSLYHVTMLTDQHITNPYWQLYEGMDLEGKLLFESGGLPQNVFLTWSFCLPSTSYYTFFFMAASSGLQSPCGFVISTNHQQFAFETGTLPWNRDKPNSNTTVVINAYQHLQPHITYYFLAPFNEPIPANWKDIDCSISTWDSILLDNLSIKQSSYPSYYLRKIITLDSFDNLNTLMIQCQFTGGIIVYMNSVTIYRVNLPEQPSQFDYAWNDHNSTQWSSFSLLLQGGIIQEGKNIMAIEYHLAKDSTQPIHLDFISQFTVSSIESIPITASFINGTEPYSSSSGTLANLFDLHSYTTFRPVFKEGTFFEFTLENDARSPFNAYGFLPANNIHMFDYHLEGQVGRTDKWIELDAQYNFNVTDRTWKVMPLPEGLTGWKRVRFVVDMNSVYVFNLMEFVLLSVTHETEGMCPYSQGYYGVSDMEWSYIRCDRGYSGYKRRQCLNGIWSDEINECEKNGLTYISYPHSFYNLTVGIPFSIEAQMDGLATSVILIPNNLTVDIDGRIHGTVTSPSHTVYTIIAKDAENTVETTIELVFHDTYCTWYSPALHIKAGEDVSLPCDTFIKNTMGTYHMQCIVATADEGKWVEDGSQCFTIGFLFSLLFLSLCLLVFAVMLIVKKLKKRAKKQESHANSNV